MILQFVNEIEPDCSNYQDDGAPLPLCPCPFRALATLSPSATPALPPTPANWSWLLLHSAPPRPWPLLVLPFACLRCVPMRCVPIACVLCDGRRMAVVARRLCRVVPGEARRQVRPALQPRLCYSRVSATCRLLLLLLLLRRWLRGQRPREQPHTAADG